MPAPSSPRSISSSVSSKHVSWDGGLLFYSSHTGISQKAVFAVILDQVLQPGWGLPQLSRQSD